MASAIDPDTLARAWRALGRQLATYRQSASLGQHDLAPLVNYGRSTIANVETGRQKCPRRFWEQCDRALAANGALLRAFDELTSRDRDYQRKSTDDQVAHALVKQEPAQTTAGKSSLEVPDQSAGNDRPVATNTAGLTPRTLFADAQAAAVFARRVSSSGVDELSLDQIDADVRLLARQYVSTPLTDLFCDIRNLRTEVSSLIDANRFPGQIRRLHVAAARLCGLQAHVSLDLGYYPHADTFARSALQSANAADHQPLHGWTRALQSLIAYWEGRLTDAVALADDGCRYAGDMSTTVRLRALRARASAALGDTSATRAALDQARDARARSLPDDDIGGVFGFPAAKQATYAGTTMLRLGTPDLADEAIAESTRAIELYEAAAPADRSAGDLVAARLDLATAYILGDDLDGADQQTALVLTTPPGQRTASIRKRATTLAGVLAERRYTTTPLASSVREALTTFSSQTPSLPDNSDQDQP